MLCPCVYLKNKQVLCLYDHLKNNCCVTVAIKKKQETMHSHLQDPWYLFTFATI